MLTAPPNRIPRQYMDANFLNRLNELSISEAARQCLPGCESPQDFVRRLRDTNLDGDALKVLPILLPNRVAIWWGCLCVWDAQQSKTDKTRQSALEAIVHWVQLPSETHRRTCEHFGRVLGVSTSPGALAMAVFWSGGSITAPDQPYVPAPAGLAAKVVGAAVQAAAMERDPVHYHDHFRQYLAIGLEVAAGRVLWTPSGTVADRPANPCPPLDAPEVNDRLQILHTGGHWLHGPHSSPRGVGAGLKHSPSLFAHKVLQ